MQITGYILLFSAALIAMFGQSPNLAKLGSDDLGVANVLTQASFQN